ncbi:MAG TPA: hypothetical protein VGK88_11140 [bacterium]|jgi:uncharacterized protein YhbP (UPF0306 family)
MAARLIVELVVDPGGHQVTKRFSQARLRGSVSRILRTNVLCSMATTRGAQAHINTAYFCYSPDLELFFLSDPHATHCRNVAVNPSMAMAVFSSAQVWGKPDAGLQFFGRCAQAMGDIARTAQRLYSARFRDYSSSDLHRYRFYRFVPQRVKIFDERALGGGVFVVARIRRKPG